MSQLKEIAKTESHNSEDVDNYVNALIDLASKYPDGTDVDVPLGLADKIENALDAAVETTGVYCYFVAYAAETATFSIAKSAQALVTREMYR